MKKFYYLLVALVLGFTASATDYVINGVGNNWAAWTKAAAQANGHLFTETSAGVYELDLNETLSGSFLIVGLNAAGTNGDWDTKVASNGKGIVAGTPYKYTKGGQNNLAMANNAQVDKPHIKLDTNAGTLLISGQESQNQFDVVYMIGDFGSGWDATVTDYPLSRVAGKDNEYEGTYTINTTALNSDYFFTVPKCGNVVLQLSGADVVPESGRPYTVQPGSDKSFSLTPGTYTFRVTAKQDAATGVVIITAKTPVITDNTIYWDNTEAQWSSLCATVSDGTNSEDLEMSDLGNGFWNVEVPSTYTTVTFKDFDDAANTSDAYTIHDNYMYSLSNSGSAYEEPVDYSTWYVNVLGEFNGWSDNGLQSATGITTHKNLAIGNKGFKVKVWNGTENWHSNGQAIALDTPTAIPNNSDSNMTVAGAAEGDTFDVTFNCKTNEITITKSGAIDYTGWYFNVVGDFNSWSTDNGVEFNADGTAVNTYENVNTAFKVRVYDGETDHDYAKTGTLTANAWNDINANQDDMVLPEDLQTGAVKFTFDNTKKALYIERGVSGVDSITAEDNAEPVYYNLQGIRVDNPENGVFIVVRGDKVSKQIVK